MPICSKGEKGTHTQQIGYTRTTIILTFGLEFVTTSKDVIGDQYIPEPRFSVMRIAHETAKAAHKHEFGVNF